MPMPEDLKPIGIGVDPLTRKECTFYVSVDALEGIEAEAPWKFDDEQLLPDAVKAIPPCVAFREVSWDGSSGAYCYVSKPNNIPQASLFIVYFVDGPPGTFSGPVVIDWDWQEEEPDKPGFPVDWDNDFGEMLWHKKT